MRPGEEIQILGASNIRFSYGWLEKGVRAVSECPTVFSEEDALVKLV